MRGMRRASSDTKRVGRNDWMISACHGWWSRYAFYIKGIYFVDRRYLPENKCDSLSVARIDWCSGSKRIQLGLTQEIAKRWWMPWITRRWSGFKYNPQEKSHSPDSNIDNPVFQKLFERVERHITTRNGRTHLSPESRLHNPRPIQILVPWSHRDQTR